MKNITIWDVIKIILYILGGWVLWLVFFAFFTADDEDISDFFALLAFIFSIVSLILVKLFIKVSKNKNYKEFKEQSIKKVNNFFESNTKVIIISIGIIFFLMISFPFIEHYYFIYKNNTADYSNSISVITKNTSNEEINYYKINNKRNIKKTSKFQSDNIEILNVAKSCFTSYIDREKNKVLNKLETNSCYIQNSNNEDVKIENELKEIIYLVSKLEHDIIKTKIIKYNNDYYVVVALNVNLWSPYDLYKYDKAKNKLQLIYDFDGEDVIGLKINVNEKAVKTDPKIIKKINQAIINKDTKKVKKLIKGVNLNTIYDVGNELGFCDAEEETYEDCLAPIQVAYLTNNYEIVKLLIDNGADVNFNNDLYYTKGQSTPLGNIITEYWGQDNIFNEETYQIVELLIKNGASVATDDGTYAGTPIEKLVSRHYKTDEEKKVSLKIFKLFIENGAEFSSNDYVTPLIELAKQSKNEYIVKYLEENTNHY